MTPPDCDTTPRHFDSVEWPKYRLDFLASPEGCIFQTAFNAWDSVPAVALVRMVNTSDETIEVSFVPSGVLTPKALWDAEYPEQILDWNRQRSAGGEIVTAPLVPGEMREFGPTWMTHSLLSGRMAKGVTFAQPPLPVDYIEGRTLVADLEFVIRMGGPESMMALRRKFQATFTARYFPLPPDPE
ncbi:hypothetical protein [Jannaschia pohangensis]|uniref:Uncharacterized protein n=1 Tax=Jannaschia pohangensis TaxID=390807 RepID=A0A1I3U5T4_9RHOB|nr:hypothetical protein [Jannaschia pohangensis]SFJ78938.1 hypothetical protein SAMN04488095_3659 [Jannaschia pohangensis]